MSDFTNEIEQAEEFITNGKFSAAIDLLQQIVNSNENNAEAFYLLSKAYSKIEKSEESLTAIQKAIALNPNEPDYLIYLCYTHYINNDTDKVLQLCEQILNIDSNNYEALRLLGMLAKDNNDYIKAIEYFELVVNIANDEDAMIMLLECYIEEAYHDKAKEIFAVLKDSELSEDQKEEKDELFVRYMLDMAMLGWTGVEKQEDGSNRYYPETEKQIEESENYIKMAQEVGTNDEYYNDRMKEMQEALAVNRDYLEDNNLTGNDKSASELLEQLFDLWSGKEVVDGYEYRWPDTVEDIKNSKWGLKQIKKLNPQNKKVLARYNELKGVVDTQGNNVPKYMRQMLRAIVFSIIGIAILFAAINISKFKSPEFEFNASNWVLNTNTDLMFDAFVGESAKEKGAYKPLYAGNKLTPIARKGRWWVKVKTQNGNMGYLDYRDISGAKNIIIDKTTPFFTNYTTKAFTDSIKAGEKATVLNYFVSKEADKKDMVQIKRASGKIGYVPYYRFDAPFISSIPEINQSFIYPTTLSNVKNKMVGKTLKQLEKRYGPFESIITNNGIKKAYLKHISLIDNSKEYNGIFFDINANNQAVAYNLREKTSRVKLIDKFPFTQDVRQFEPFGLLSFSYYKGKELEFKWWKKFKNMGWFTKIVAWIIKFLIIIIVVFLIFSIPHLVINPLTVLLSYTKFLGNGTVLFLNFLIYGFAAYLYLIWMALLMDQFLIAAIVSTLVFGAWWFLHKTNIRYNRCPNCHNMNVGLNEGSSYHGRTASVTTGTQNRFSHSSTSGNVQTNYYNKVHTKTTELTDHYTDHRACLHCGYNWGVKREESAGSNYEEA
ncbi:MAG: hypothetical protein JEZ09_04855 [Salinivirgaceae bacterium]|nr:hypothetical protein [Salinivirgaceae bacterium]